MNSKIRILHVLNHSYPYTDGYAIRGFNIINGQRRYGMDPAVLTSPKHEPDYTVNPEVFQETCYYRIPRHKPFQINSVLSNNYIIYAIFRHIKKIYQQKGFDLIHAHSPALCGLGAMLFSMFTGIPFIYEIRAFWEDAAVDAGKYATGSLKYRIMRILESFVIKRADAVVTITDYLKNDILARSVKKPNVFLIPNGVDRNHFYPMLRNTQLAKELGIGEYPVIGFIGSFYRFEGLDVLLKALSLLKKQNLKYKAILVGSGEMDAEWRQLAEKLELSNVIFTGRVPYEDILRYYSVIDIFVYPRHSERLTELVTPLKPLEAMAMGKLVIGSDVGGIKEIIGKGGIFFPAGDYESLFHLLKDVINNRAKYESVAEEGKKLANEKYSWDRHIEKYQKIYHIVLSSDKD